MNKDALLKKILMERQKLDETFALLNESQMNQSGVVGELSAKDILGHITDWERRLKEWLETAAAGETPQILGPGLAWDDVAAADRESLVRNRFRPAADMIAESRQVFTDLLAQLERLPEFTDSDGWAVWEDGKPPIDLIEANTYHHYHEHAQSIWAWLAKQDLAPAKLAADNKA